MRSYLKYLLLTGAIAGCTVETVDNKGSGGTGSTTGGTKATGGTGSTLGGASTTTTAGASSSSVGGGTGTSIGGSAAAGGSSPVGGTTAVGGSTSPAATAGGATAASGGTGTVSSSTSQLGGATGTGGTGTVGSTVAVTGGASSVGGTSATSTGGNTAVSTTEPDASTNLPVIKLDLAACAVIAPTTWTKAVYDTSGCLGVVTVLSALTIEAGSIIKFAPDSYLDVIDTATLKAIGTEADPIIFTSIKDDAHGGDTGGDGATSPTKGDWGTDGLGAVDVNGSGSQLDYVEILYGINGLGVHGASSKVTNSTFAHSAGNGALLDGTGVGSTTLTGNAFFDNGSFPLSLSTFVSLDASNIFHDPGNTAVKNAKQCIEILEQPSVATAVSLGVTELAFYGSFAVESALTVANGVCFKTEANGEIDLGAAGSIVNGANAIFTSAKDDAVGGDCTGDGATAPADGDWAGIWVTTSATSDWASPTANIRYTDQAENPGTMPLH